MTEHVDLVNRGGLLVDGTGAPARPAIVNGVVTRRHDTDTGARPGRLVRG